MAKRTSLLGVLILLLAVQVASAQPPGGGRGRGGFRGGPGGPGGGPMPELMLLRIPEVREELGTKDDQNKQLDELFASMQPPERPNFEELQKLSEDERRERMEAMRAKQEASFREIEEKLGNILDEKQLARFRQLRLQRQGVGALMRPELAKQLELTEEQRDKIRKIQEGARPEGRGPGNFQEMSDEERREFFTQMRERREKADAEILAVLTDEQKTKWNELQGEKFDFPRGGFGGPGGGFGRGPGGPGGPPQERRRPPRKEE